MLDRVDLRELIVQTADLFRLTAREARMEVVVQAEQGCEWLGYPGSLSQVLLNLLSNAQRYAGGRVEVTLTAQEEDYVVVVRDFGQGIPAENLPRIFEPFFTTGRAKGGSGLGLSIVYTIVTAHLKGTIAVASEAGQGTTVTLSLPAA